MKLYLHNILQDNSDGSIHYPLHIEVENPECVSTVEVEVNEPLLITLSKRVDYLGLTTACKDLGIEYAPPADIENPTPDELTALHHVLFEIEVNDGTLVSPTGKRFPIINGIPDMAPSVGAEPEDEEAEE